MKARLKRLRDRLKTQKLDAILITSSQNQAYLTDFPDPSGFLLLAERELVFITDFCYFQEIRKSHPGIRIEEQGPSRLETLAGILKELGVERLGFEAPGTTYSDYQELAQNLSDIRLIPTRGMVEEMRLVKDNQEIGLMRRAAQIGDRVFADIVNFIKPGLAEYEVGNKLEYLIRAAGGAKSAFSIVVASGPRASLPHAAPSDRVLSTGDMLLLDYGVNFRGYNSDMTRTLFLGRITGKQRDIYQLVLQAQLKALASVRPGMKCAKLDRLARDIIARNGYGEFFGHGLGHGIGRAVHEEPRLAQGSTSTLEAGMTITIEPGIYIPDWGGVRIEDTALVTDGGCEVLTKAPKEIMVL